MVRMVRPTSVRPLAALVVLVLAFHLCTGVTPRIMGIELFYRDLNPINLPKPPPAISPDLPSAETPKGSSSAGGAGRTAQRGRGARASAPRGGAAFGRAALRGHAEGHAGQHAVQLRQHLADGLGRAGAGGDDVEARAAPAAPVLHRGAVDDLRAGPARWAGAQRVRTRGGRARGNGESASAAAGAVLAKRPPAGWR